MADLDVGLLPPNEVPELAGLDVQRLEGLGFFYVLAQVSQGGQYKLPVTDHAALDVLAAQALYVASCRALDLGKT